MRKSTWLNIPHYSSRGSNSLLISAIFLLQKQLKRKIKSFAITFWNQLYSDFSSNNKKSIFLLTQLNNIMMFDSIGTVHKIYEQSYKHERCGNVYIVPVKLMVQLSHRYWENHYSFRMRNLNPKGKNSCIKEMVQFWVECPPQECNLVTHQNG